MTTHRHALTLLSIVGLATLGCDQAKPRCAVAPGDFAARYEKTGGDCEGIAGDVLSIQVYYQPRSDKDKSPDFEKITVGLLPSALAGVRSHAVERGATLIEDADPNTDEWVAFGAFTTTKAADDEYCTIPAMTTARVRVPAIPEVTDECGTLPAEDAVDEQYKFNNVRVYNSPGAYGTQLTADLTYTSATCSGTYRVTAVYPAIGCGVPPPDGTDAGVSDGVMDAGTNIDASLLDATSPLDPDGGQILPQEEEPTDPQCPAPAEDTGPMVPDDGACQGTGISPEFTASCDPTLLLCLLPGQSTAK